MTCTCFHPHNNFLLLLPHSYIIIHSMNMHSGPLVFKLYYRMAGYVARMHFALHGYMQGCYNIITIIMYFAMLKCVVHNFIMGMSYSLQTAAHGSSISLDRSLLYGSREVHINFFPTSLARLINFRQSSTIAATDRQLSPTIADYCRQRRVLCSCHFRLSPTSAECFHCAEYHQGLVDLSDYCRRQLAICGDYRRKSAIIDDCRKLGELKRSEKMCTSRLPY